jgi:hypothetical protein
MRQTLLCFNVLHLLFNIQAVPFFFHSDLVAESFVFRLIEGQRWKSIEDKYPPLGILCLLLNRLTSPDTGFLKISQSRLSFSMLLSSST